MAAPLQAGEQLAPGAAGAAPATKGRAAMEWARELVGTAVEPLVPRSAYAGGALAARTVGGGELAMELRKYHLDVHVEDGFARTTIDQTYFNPGTNRTEGTFYFPLPADASLSRLAMYVDGRRMEGGMVERTEARRIYESIVAKLKDPALLEWVDGTTFKMRVFPIEARQEKRIVLSYTQKLPWLAGQATYRFPGGHSLGKAAGWSLNVRVRSAGGTAWECPSHALTPAKDGDDLVLTDKGDEKAQGDDVVLTLHEPSAAGEEAARFSSFEQEGAKYLMVRYRPAPAAAPRTKEPRHWVFLLETSGDRNPLLARTQIEIMREMLQAAEHADTFNVATAGTRARVFSQAPEAVTKENIARAVEFAESARLVGAMDVGNALTVAGELRNRKRGSAERLVYLGSGNPVLGVRDQKELVRTVGTDCEYVGIGVGKKWNRTFMREAAAGTGGYFTQINPDENLKWRAMDVMAALNGSRLVGAAATAGDVAMLAGTDAVSAGEEFWAVARLDKGKALPASVTIRGRRDGKEFLQTLPVANVAAGAGYLPRTWARLEIDRLLAAGAEANKAAITELSRTMYVMSPFASLLVLENEAMYARYGVERGRKDHWAMYDCPETIPTAPKVEPVQTRGAEREPSWQEMRSWQEKALSRVLVWVSVPFLQPESWRQDDPRTDHDGREVRSAWDMLFPAIWIVLPNIESQDLQSSVTVPEGGTVLLGGFKGGGKGQRDPIREWIDRSNSTGRIGQIERWPYGEMGDRRSNFADADKDPSLDLGDLDYSVPSVQEDFVRLSQRRIVFRTNNILQDAAQWTLSRDRQEDEFEGRDDFGHLRDNLGYVGQSEAAGGVACSQDFSLLDARSQARMFPAGWAPGVERRRVGSGWIYYPGLSMGGWTSHAGSDAMNAWLRVGGESPSPRAEYPPVQALGAGRRSMDYDIRDRLVSVPNFIGPRIEISKLGQNMQSNDNSGLFGGGAGPAGDQELEPIRGVLDVESDRSNAPLWWYQRPAFSGVNRYLIDLTLYAPALNTSCADVQAVLEASAPAAERVKAGQVDPRARRLIAAARSPVWRMATWEDAGGIGASVVFDGEGRFSYRGHGPGGIIEWALCDGTTLVQVYPEIGLGARRAVSRFHRADAVTAFPWLVAPVDDLAAGMDVSCDDGRTVVLTPIGASSARDKQGRPVPYAALRMAFGEGGRLVERRFVSMPSGKLLRRQAYAPDGTVALFDESGRELAVWKCSVVPAAAPNLKPALDDMVVLPMPLRDVPDPVQTATAPAWDEAHALEWIAGKVFGRWHAGAGADAIMRRFVDKGDRRIGWQVLVAAVCGEAPVSEEMKNTPLGRFLTCSADAKGESLKDDEAQGRRWRKATPAGAADWGGGFIGRVGAFRQLWWAGWAPGAPDGREKNLAAWREAALAYAERTGPTEFTWALLAEVARQGAGKDAERLAEAFERFGTYTGRYEAARARKDGEAFATLFRATIARGWMPMIDPDFVRATETGPLGGLVRTAVTEMIARDARAAAIELGRQCWDAGARDWGNWAVRSALQTAPASQREALAVEAVSYYAWTQQWEAADEQMGVLLAAPAFAKDARTWRVASRVAAKRGWAALAARRFERAVEIDIRRMQEKPDDVNLREDYEELFLRYRDLARSVATLGPGAVGDVTDAALRAADRWRALDEEGGACKAAADVLAILGAGDLAWEYATTPLADMPEEPEPWLQLARWLVGKGQYDLAARAYETVARIDPADPGILWDHASVLSRLGKAQEARALYSRVAEGQWPEKYKALKAKAKEKLGG
ncbi:MAG: VIT domain-containing protein [Planctomycetota bacterium]|nr:VIT domain-containing protein [Planctomycetota bacterium]